MTWKSSLGSLSVSEAITRLAEMGYQVALEGDEVVLTPSQGVQLDQVQVRRLAAVLRARKPEALAYLRNRRGVVNPPCRLCPWSRPYHPQGTHHDWCEYHGDYLLPDSGWCSDKREGQVPEREKPLTLDTKVA